MATRDVHNLVGTAIAAMVACLTAAAVAIAAEDLSKPQDPTHGSKFSHQGVYLPEAVYMPDQAEPGFPHPSEATIDKWNDLKFGLCIHWSVYSIEGHIPCSWELCGKPLEWMGKYHELYKTWNPHAFDADEWMKMMRRGGIKYFWFTAKHHDGFSMFDTNTRVKKRISYSGPKAGQIEDCDLAYSIMETPFKRDVTKELVNAARRHGITPGLYFSHIDWYDADFRFDYFNPRRDLNYNAKSDPEGWARFRNRYKGQMRELLTNYGPLCEVFFDIGFPEHVWPDVREMIGIARPLQPECLFSHRGIGAYGDYCVPEQVIPRSAMSDDFYFPREVAHSLHTAAFGYTGDSAGYRSGEWLVQALVDVVAKGGNLILGVGPDGNGRFHPKAIEALDYAGQWLDVNGEAIFATRPWQHWNEGETIRFTQSKDGKYVYAICLVWPGESLVLKSVRANDGSTVKMLGVDRPLAWRNDPERGLVVEMPVELQDSAKRPCQKGCALRIEGTACPLAASAASTGP